MSDTAARFDPFSSSAPLIVYIDFKSPYAYLAKDPTWALGDEFGIDIDWRPFTLDIPSYLGSARLHKDGRQVAESQRTDTQWKMVKAAYSDVRRYGTMRDLIVRGTVKIWDSSLAGIAMLWAKQQSKAVLHRYIGITYERFWKRELDIEDIAIVEGVLGEAGAPTREFRQYASGVGRALHDEIQTKSFDAGIFGVPTYIVGGEMFFGREHLPRIRWILGGRRGAPPDIAYEGGKLPLTGSHIQRALIAAIDFASARSYLAIKPTCELADRLGIEIAWEPMVVEVKPPKPASRTDDRGLRHRAIRAEYVARDLARYLADRGIVGRDLNQQADSTAAAITLLWLNREAKHLARRFVETIFERYWHDELKLEDEAALRRVLEEIGAPLNGYESFIKEEGPRALAEVRSRLENVGVLDGPSYLVGDEVFLGREHLPLIQDRLASA
jgi:2-hydroxychromene-2-carboxylate isomerase